MGASATRDRLVRMLAPVVGAAGLDLEDLEFTPAGRHTLLRVTVDADEGVTADRLAAATSEVSRALEASERSTGDGVVLPSPYTLEVSTPGLDRPLAQPRHWRRNQGRLVRVLRRDGRELLGRIVAAGEDTAELEVDGERCGLAYEQVAVARVQVEFRRGGDRQPATDRTRRDDVRTGRRSRQPSARKR